MKKAGIVLIILLIISASVFAAFHYKMHGVEQAVLAHLINEEKVPADRIQLTEGFIANLSGERNWMVAVKLKQDDKSYFYYKNSQGEVILESYTEDGVEHYVDE
ncbi:hypothetical protein QWY16_17945 [Planococcus shenhongbingii]|uniref:DUF3139 domain-containing protein n=1 Tax=Planococcus shenhongbingii TaxID=3058398 RepID=A0ABT8NBH6_9BACL|nr:MULTISPECIES: hypothetical protein [unclassified Planococcus (in: firmicutes)]MDN7245247.1 hypothetical protein [Planococcus sp. N017]WKA58355.1 hypothetical protein QWY16_17945 [Planococcus sp. N016]